MKYEMIFGDERLFDGTSEFVEVIRFNDYSREYLWGDLNTIQLLTFRELKAIPIVAMRRIIADPKRWTVADQKAGLLPDVGSLVEWNDCGVKLKVTIESAFFNKSCAFSFEGRGIGIAEIFDLSPIETPEEKAQREEDEFVDSLKSVEIHDGTVKSFFAQGACAAYRKLKGGE